MITHVSPPQCALIQPDDPEGLCFPANLQQELSQMVRLPPVESFTAKQVLAQTHWLKNARFLMSTWWGMPQLDETLLEAMPKLEAVFNAGGTIDGFMTLAAWERGIRISTSIALNSESVAQFTLSQILFSLKMGWHHIRQAKQANKWQRMSNIPGTHGTRVGIVSTGLIGRRVIELLKYFDVELLAYDIQPDQQLAARCNVRYVSLHELFGTCSVVSLHTPLLPTSRKMITGQLIELMPVNSTLINTSRGGVIDQVSMIKVLQNRPDLIAMLDVTDPEPPDTQSPLWEMPNVFLTPHIAGTFGKERQRLGAFAIDELRRYLNNEPLLGEVPNPYKQKVTARS